jgi:hypothetical protein
MLWPLPSLSEPKRYDPDPQACQPLNIRRSYQANLLPWGDQPPVVQERLRQLQAAMTRDTLQSCQAKGLLTSDQVSSLVVELGLSTAPAGPASGPGTPSPLRP